MKTLKDLNITIISCKDAKTNELKDELYAINAVLYTYQKRYINNSIKNKLINSIIDIGKQIKAYKPKSSIGGKKQAYILSVLKVYYNGLKLYQPYINKYDECATKSFKYILSQYLRKKDTIMTSPEAITDTLKDIKTILDDWSDNTPPYALKKAIDELLTAYCTHFKKVS